MAKRCRWIRFNFVCVTEYPAMNSYVLIGGLAAGQGGSQLPRLSALRMSNRSSNLPLPSDLEPPQLMLDYARGNHAFQRALLQLSDSPKGA